MALAVLSSQDERCGSLTCSYLFHPFQSLNPPRKLHCLVHAAHDFENVGEASCLGGGDAPTPRFAVDRRQLAPHRVRVAKVDLPKWGLFDAICLHDRRFRPEFYAFGVTPDRYFFAPINAHGVGLSSAPAPLATRSEAMRELMKPGHLVCPVRMDGILRY